MGHCYYWLVAAVVVEFGAWKKTERLLATRLFK
jgi:hypothetical protein